MFIRYDGTFWREETLTLDMIARTLTQSTEHQTMVTFFTGTLKNSTWVPNTVTKYFNTNVSLVGQDIIFTRDDTTLYSVNVNPLFTSVNTFSDVDTTGYIKTPS